VIGPGGGPDVIAALASGSRKVTAVEMNPLMIQFVRHYGERAGRLYDRPDVEVIQSEGRNFISRTDRKFDTIFLRFVDSWASVPSVGGGCCRPRAVRWRQPSATRTSLCPHPPTPQWTRPGLGFSGGAPTPPRLGRAPPPRRAPGPPRTAWGGGAGDAQRIRSRR